MRPESSNVAASRNSSRCIEGTFLGGQRSSWCAGRAVVARAGRPLVQGVLSDQQKACLRRGFSIVREFVGVRVQKLRQACERFGISFFPLVQNDFERVRNTSMPRFKADGTFSHCTHTLTS
jgi:hypothetical protein